MMALGVGGQNAMVMDSEGPAAKTTFRTAASDGGRLLESRRRSGGSSTL